MKARRDAYEVKTSARAKRITITVRRDGSVLVTKPRWISRARAEAFVEKNGTWIADTRSRMRKLPQLSHLGGTADYRRHKRRAATLISAQVARFARRYGVAVRSISVRNQRSRWGSCSARGALSFNYRVAFLPDALSDYIVVHEICHLLEHNHSRRFWAHVARAIPEYADCRARLRALEHGLNA